MKQRITFLALFFTITTYAQLSKVHYIPPFCTFGEAALGVHNLYLTTPTEETFYVMLYDGVDTFVDSIAVSKDEPALYELGNYPNQLGCFYFLKDLNRPLNKGGLRLEADKAFFANVRNSAGNQAASLTSKGVAGLGTEFRTGHMYVGYRADGSNYISSHFITITATQNNTKVNITDISPKVVFHGLPKKKDDPSTTADHHFILNKGQSYMIAEKIKDVTRGYENNSFGTKITSNKPIAVNCGTTLGVNPLSVAGWDNGFDQIAPVDIIGDEYILMRGEGIDELEQPVVVAAYDSTTIYVNGEEMFILNAGEYHAINGEYYTGKGNMYIQGNKEFYVYQAMAGDMGTATAGLNFVPPIGNCHNSNQIVVSDVGFLGTFVSLGIVAHLGSKVFIYDTEKGELIRTFQGKRSNLAKGLDMDYVSYRFSIPLAVNDILVQSDKVMNVSLSYNSALAGSASYFSGFIPKPYLIARGGQISFYANGYLDFDIGHADPYDKFEWYKDATLISTSETPILRATEAGEYFVRCFSSDCGNQYDTKTFVIESLPEVAMVEEEELFEEAAETVLEAAIKNDDFDQKVLVNINYKYNSEEFVPEATPLLDEMIVTLKKYSAIDIEIRAHTDCRGNDAYNLTLSQKRADYVKKYLVENGIEEQRLSAKGFGESEPLPMVDCNCDIKDDCKEHHHLMNRRSEFVIIK